MFFRTATKIFFISIIFASVLFFFGCGKNEAIKTKNTIQEPDFESIESIQYAHPYHQITIKHLADFEYDTSGLYGMYVLDFPESYTTGTNLIGGHIRLDAGLSTCDDFNSKETSVMAWRNSESFIPTGNLLESFSVDDNDFYRIKCYHHFDDSVFSESVSYVTNIEDNYYSLSLFLYSIDPILCDPEICKKWFEPVEFEKVFLRVLKSFKKLKLENYE